MLTMEPYQHEAGAAGTRGKYALFSAFGSLILPSLPGKAGA